MIEPISIIILYTNNKEVKEVTLYLASLKKVTGNVTEAWFPGIVTLKGSMDFLKIGQVLSKSAQWEQICIFNFITDSKLAVTPGSTEPEGSEEQIKISYRLAKQKYSVRPFTSKLRYFRAPMIH